MSASMTSVVSRRDQRGRNFRTALVLIGVTIFLIAISVATILVKN